MKSALVTGANRGLGMAAVKALLQEGYRVYGGYRSEEGRKALENLHSNQVFPLCLDVTKEDHLADLKQKIEGGEIAIDLLVNNAGIGVEGPVLDVDFHLVKEAFEINTFGLLKVTQICLPSLKKTKGRIVNLSSGGGFFPFPGGGIYSATKFSVHALTHVMRLELFPYGVQVMLFCPGVFDTEIWSQARKRFEMNQAAETDHYTKNLQKLSQSLLSHPPTVESYARRLVKELRRPKLKPMVIFGRGNLFLRLAVLLPLPLRDFLFRMHMSTLSLPSVLQDNEHFPKS